MPLAPRLSAVNATPASALQEYGLMILKFQTAYDMVFENRVTKAFLRAIPGLDDYALLGKAWFHTTEQTRGRPTWDTVVFDMPASGHSMSMLRIPKVIVETVPEGPLTRDARSVMSLLRNDALTAAVVVTLAEEMPANEACELSEKLRSELEIKTAQLVINQVYPSGVVEAPTAKVLQAIVEAVKQAGVTADPVLRGLAAHGDLVAARRKLNVHYIAQLRAQIQAPTAELPMLFTPTLGPGEIRQLSELLTKTISSA